MYRDVPGLQKVPHSAGGEMYPDPGKQKSL